MTSGAVMSKFNGKVSIVESNGVTNDFAYIMAWNMTYDPNQDGQLQNVVNATFTTFVRIIPDNSVVYVKNINNNTLAQFYTGTPIYMNGAELYIQVNNNNYSIQLRNATNGYVITDAQVTTTGGLDITQTG
uniref:Uncharacterized protein n=1 Tax=Acrobeloides nanus TaxID=290746 RepID=A0A914EIB9_9BILA